MVAVSLLQVKKLHWGKLSQVSQGKLSAPKYCEFSDENCEQLYTVFHCQNDLKRESAIFFFQKFDFIKCTDSFSKYVGDFANY